MEAVVESGIVVNDDDVLFCFLVWLLAFPVLTKGYPQGPMSYDWTSYMPVLDNLLFYYMD